MREKEVRVRLRGRSVRRAVVRYSLIVLTGAVLVGVATAFALKAREDDRVAVRALVIAQNLDVTVDELEASVRPIFRFGGVAEDAIVEHDLDVPPSALKGDLVDVVVSGPPVLQVVGRDEDPTRAAELANAVAHSLVAALNSAGGIGTFAVVEEADPARADDPASVPVLFVAVVAGVISMLAFYWALISSVRPIFTSEELAEVSTSPSVVTIGGPGSFTAQGLAEILARRHPSWLMVGFDADHSDRLLAELREARPDLDISATGLDSAAFIRRDRSDSLVVLIVNAGSSQRAVRNAEALAGEQLAATVMVGVGR
jgi:capsular polysaccharide biosynthesis protein